MPGKLSTAGRFTVDLYLLTWAAGAMDALSYLRAGVFTANMTGNTVILGLAVAGPERSKVYFSLLSLCSFAIGALLGSVVLVRRKDTAEGTEDLKTGLAWELPLSIFFAVLWAISAPDGQPSWTVPVMTIAAACGLGIQSVAVRRMRISGVVTTFITGTITTTMTSLVQRSEGEKNSDSQNHEPPLVLVGMFLLYVAGALTAAELAVARTPWAPVMAVAPLAWAFGRCWMRGREPAR